MEDGMVGRKLSALLAVAALALGVTAGPAFGWGNPPPQHKQHCNSGNGNGSEPITTTPGEHCYYGDPGNSYNAGNKGGDEIPSSGGVPNPGGNNVD
jgi:hypothetical protein